MLPDKKGHFGFFGGKFVPETVMSALEELEKVYLRAKSDKKFQEEFNYYLTEYAGRPTPLYRAERLEKKLRGAKIYFESIIIALTSSLRVSPENWAEL